MRGRERPSGGHRPPFTSEATEAPEVQRLFRGHTQDLIPDPNISRSSHVLSILLLLGRALGPNFPHGGYQQERTTPGSGFYNKFL